VAVTVMTCPRAPDSEPRQSVTAKQPQWQARAGGDLETRSPGPVCRVGAEAAEARLPMAGCYFALIALVTGTVDRTCA
jgi:hypothetical protein